MVTSVSGDVSRFLSYTLYLHVFTRVFAHFNKSLKVFAEPNAPTEGCEARR